MRKTLLTIAAFAALPGFAQNNYSKRFARTIRPEVLKSTLSVIASAEMEGRETTTPGQKRAAVYIENRFKSLGLLPGTSAGFQMYFPIYVDTLMDASLIVNGKKFALGSDYAFTAATIPSGNWVVKEVVFVAGGIDSTTAHFKELDVKGRWVVIDGATDTDSSQLRNRAMAMRVMQAQLRQRGAKGIIIASKDFPKRDLPLKGNMYLKKAPANNFPVLTVSYQVASSIFNRPINSSADLPNNAPVRYPVNLSLSVYKRSMIFESSNVIGVLPGTDKKDEYVILTSHYDHLGKRGDVIYFGADDDGSGTTAVLQMAEAFAEANASGYRPRRTIVFMTVSGEEKGLLGSEFYSDNPIFPLNKTSVNLNTDMVGRIDPGRTNGDSTNYVYVIGDDKLSSDLAKITDSVNAKYVKLELDRRYNDLADPNRFYYRSDHYNFAKKGVPIIFYFNGSHADYHRPTDTVEKINFDLMAKRVQLVFHTAWVMANRNDMMKRDIPLK